MNETKLHELLGKMVSELGAAYVGASVIIGDQLGLYKALAANDALTAEQLAARTGTTERYLREWLAGQAASGYIEYDTANQTFHLTPEQALVFAHADSPVIMTGGFYTLQSVYADVPRVTEAFRTGQGIGWGEHCNCLFCGVAKFFGPGYRANLIASWLPSIDGIVPKLETGGKVADVGCGHGISTVLMAQAFPNSHFFGFDYHPASIEQARALAKEQNVPNVTFEVATAKSYPGKNYDFVTCFDCLHDMGDPVGAAAHVLETLNHNGVWMIVEPMAQDDLAGNLNPVGRIYYAASTMICLPTSLSQEVGLGLGAQAGEAKLRDVVTKGGFTRFHRATETPFNMVLDARP
ncbi:MAG TPA: methyltransferase domain-containing protein [Caldilineaceae bacterium]|nr:methyltransferase domain-containing protein [Caldilineaceae bacterium]